MKLRRFITLLSSLTTLGCGDAATSPQQDLGGHSLALMPGVGSADGVVRGTVLGMRLTDPTDTTSYEHVAAATVQVYLEFLGTRTDSSTAPLHQLVGSLTTDAHGTFELTDVPTGYFQLDVAPPAGSPYKPSTSGTVAFVAHSTATSIVWLNVK
jgi:hypothetical protein